MEKSTSRKVTIAIGLLIMTAIFSGITVQAANVNIGDALIDVVRPGWNAEIQSLNAAKTLFARALPVIIVLGIIVGWVQGKKAKEKPMVSAIAKGKVQRHPVSALLEHWTHTVGCIVCVVTAALLLLGTRLGRVEVFATFLLTYKLHFIGAGIMVFACVEHAVHHHVAGHRAILPDMSNLSAEIEASIAEVKAIMGLGKAPHAGKWLPIERLEYPVWGLLVGLIILTGIVKTMRYALPVPGLLLHVTTKLHVIVAIVILLLLIVHIITAALIPPSWPLFKSMLTTKTSESYVKEHHPEWYKEIKKG
ncbi:MAG: cytochrome b/b6 domain-containing protein [Methanocellales archaeon]|nr:cytochrome b/b6 domain-containing protein [Methanocellales archaeon]